MEKGIRRRTKEGSPQGGPLSPLLANIYLNEYDQEMEKRGVTVIRYADDIVVLAKSRRVALRLLESSRTYFGAKAQAPNKYAEKQGGQRHGAETFQIPRIRSKPRQERPSGHGECESQHLRMDRLFYVADMKRTLQSWNEWLRRRMRMYIWKEWNKPRAKVQNLRKLGTLEWQAYQWGNTRLGYWRITGSAVLNLSVTNERLAQAGYYNFPAQYERLRQ